MNHEDRKIRTRAIIERWCSLIFLVLVYGFLATPIHEGFHILGAKLVGTKAVADLSWNGSGLVVFTAPATLWQQYITRVFGGVGTGVAFLALWSASQCQAKYTVWETDDAWVFLTMAIYQLLYAPVDMLWGIGAPPWAIYSPVIIALAISIPLMRKRLYPWLFALDVPQRTE